MGGPGDSAYTRAPDPAPGFSAVQVPRLLHPVLVATALLLTGLLGACAPSTSTRPGEQRGTTVRGVYGRGNENYGDLYEVVNQKTLGITEQEILELVANVAGQLSAQENQFREVSLSRHRLEREDEAYKSYGVLKYARRMTLKEVSAEMQRRFKK